MYQLQDFGSFFVGGRKIVIENQPVKTVWRNKDFPQLEVDINGEYYVEQGYVQYFIPQNAQGLPVILIHGGGHSGEVWENTPDARSGWLHYFLRQNRAVYVIDNVERGRASWCSLPGVWKGEPELRSGLRTWDIFRLGEKANYVKKLPFSAQQFPIKFFDNLLKYNVPRWNTHAVESTANVAALAKIVGKCWLVVHSQSGEFGFNAVSQAHQAIQGVVAIEPATFGIADKFCKNKAFLYVFGDFIEQSELWRKIYVLGKKHRQELIANGAKVEWLDLPKLGIHGNSHLPMMDLNSDQIAQLIQNWLLANEA